MENGEDWEKHLEAIEIARALVREETDLWCEDSGIARGEHTAAALAMEMQLFAMSLRAPMSSGGTNTVEFFCELTGVDFSHMMEIMNNTITYAHAVAASEDPNGT